MSDQSLTAVVRWLKFLSRVASVAVMSTGGLVLIGWLLDIALLKSVWPGLVTMKAITALDFVLIGLALQLLHFRFGLLAAQLLSLLASLVSLLALVGYAYGVQPFYMGVVFYMQMGLPTAGTFLVLCAGLLLARPDQGLLATITSQSTGGVMARRLLPAALVIPVLLGGLRLAGEKTGIYDAEFGVSLMVVVTIAGFTALIWWNADSLNRMAARHRQTE